MSLAEEIPIDYGSRAELAEGLFYNHEKSNLLWTDIERSRIYRYSFPGRRLTEWKLDHIGSHPSTILPLSRQTLIDRQLKQPYLVSMYNNLVLWDPKTNQVSPTNSSLSQSSFRFNDGKCDPIGRLWIGTMDLYDRPNRGGLFRLGNGGVLEKKFDASLSNGLGWSLDGSIMYYIDTPERKVQIFQYNLEMQDIVRKIDEIDLVKATGKPDGMTVDAYGNLWIAMWDGSSILKIDPTTKQCVEKVNLSVSRPTNCVIAGTNLNYLMVSSARVENEPNSGHVMMVRPTSQIHGIPSSHLSL